ncbi:transcription antiterminator [Olsenella sp. HMSC062G07]|uniref:BglG family transcription antiterminator n=1 Tax=Olsenella sp. HMSC062G07 TaxID=1739330 RepID=UPI0008A2D52B|nr:PRD domain-containing protein [Olsenella sp. HMSC062G07]OFK23408.1 hypothetical protein HMPREF2826_04820 [Olsenella sp. HMSC062G07]
MYDDFSLEAVRTQECGRRLIDVVSQHLDIDLGHDYALFEFLCNHLESMARSRELLVLDNTEVQEVMAEYPSVRRAVGANRDLVEGVCGRILTDAELDYLAVHFCTALERRKNRDRRLRVIVVCNAGVGTSQLLAENLRGRFSFRVVSVIPTHEARLLAPSAADLVVSIVPLTDCPIAHVVVAPSPTSAEFEEIQRRLDVVRERRLRDGSLDEGDDGLQGLLDLIDGVVRRYAPKACPAPCNFIEERCFFAIITSIEKTDSMSCSHPALYCLTRARIGEPLVWSMNLIHLAEPIDFGDDRGLSLWTSSVCSWVWTSQCI